MAQPKPRTRKHKIKKSTRDQTHDTNVIELLTKAQAAQNHVKHRQTSNQPLTKKQKRLAKYINTKLRREETNELIQKLSQNKIDTGLLRSSKSLGKGQSSKRETFAQAFRERKAGINHGWHDEALFEKFHVSEATSHSSDAEEAAEATILDLDRTSFSSPLNVNKGSSGRFGAGLKRSLPIDESENCAVKRRKQKQEIPPQDESDWNGFSSGSDKNADQSKSTDSDFGSISEFSNDQGDSQDSTNSSFSNPSVEDHDSVSSEKAYEEGEESTQDRVSAFKAWASRQMNDAVGFEPSSVKLQQHHASQDIKVPSEDANCVTVHQRRTSGREEKDFDSVKSPFTRKPPSLMPNTLQDISSRTSNMHNSHGIVKPFNVPVERPKEIEESRSKLPILAEEQSIVETINNNICTMICASTGSGKTTQIPQFLYEAGYGHPGGPTPGLIAVTQPRRVAAVSMAQRVAKELNNLGKVSHQVRFDSTVSNMTSIEFVTDGVLLRRISSDFALSRYSVIIVDEAHERGLNTDLLIGMLVRIAETRAELARKGPQCKPLKLVIMSATLTVSELLQNATLFRSFTPPVVNVEGRQFPVTVHFSRKTPQDYLEDAFRKVSKGHRKLPIGGGFLVFLTGQSEIEIMSRRLKQAFTSTNSSQTTRAKYLSSASEAPVEADDIEDTLSPTLHRLSKNEAYSQFNHDEVEVELEGNSSQDEDLEMGEQMLTQVQKVHILPLYSALPQEQQMRIYEPPPEGSRTIVLATNVAETSLTIPGIRFVFDCGRAKQKRYDPISGIESFSVDFISKASAEQRSGRAGRTAAGHCYRLYSSAVYEQYFPKSSAPEIVNSSIEGVVLQLKNIGVPNVTKFPFPTPPPPASLLKAVHLLSNLGAIGLDNKISSHGRRLSIFPLSPRLSQILTLAEKHNCLEYALMLTSLLSTPEPFIPQAQVVPPVTTNVAEFDSSKQGSDEETPARDRKLRNFNSFHGNLARLDRHCDAIKLLVAFADFNNPRIGETNEYRTYTRIKAMKEAAKLHAQLVSILKAHKPEFVKALSKHGFKLPSASQIKVLRQIVAAGYIDQIAIRADLSPNPPADLPKARRPAEVPYITLLPTSPNPAIEESEAATPYVFIHPSSVLMHVSAANLPQYLVYSHVSRAADRIIHDLTDDSSGPPRAPRVRIHPVTPLSAMQIVALTEATPMLEENKVIGKVEILPRNQAGEERRTCWVTPFLRGRQGTMGWPLPPSRKVEQRRVAGKGWVTER